MTDKEDECQHMTGSVCPQREKLRTFEAVRRNILGNLKGIERLTAEQMRFNLRVICDLLEGIK